MRVGFLEASFHWGPYRSQVISHQFKLLLLRIASSPTLFSYLAAQPTTLLARGTGPIGASGTSRGVALEHGSVCAVDVNGLVSAEEALDFVAGALGGDAGALMRYGN